MTARLTNPKKTGQKQRLLFICLSAILVSVSAASSQTITKTIKAGNYTFTSNPDSTIGITMLGFGAFSEPGVPQLPAETFYIPLPRNAELVSISFNYASPEIIRQVTKIETASPFISSGIEKDQLNNLMPEIIRRENSIYQKNRFFPAEPVLNFGTSSLAKRPMVKIQFRPFSWNPVTGILKLISEVTVQVQYNLIPPLAGNVAAAPNLLNNFENILTKKSSAPLEITGSESSRMLIISSQNLRSAIEPLILWKSFLDVSTQFVAVEDIYSNFSGKDKTEQILNFLKDEYFNQSSFSYLLIIGHSDIVPLKKLYPNPKNHGYSGGIPTDIYYTDLDCDWDIDHDNFPGEFNDDKINWMPEINIGRIPWSDPEIISSIIKKIISFDKDQSNWKSNSLLVGAMSSFKNENSYSYYYRDTDGAVLMEIMKKDIFTKSAVTTFYEKSGVSPSAYDCDIPLTKSNLVSAWNNSNTGCLTWWAHGNSKSAFRKYWRSDNGNNIPETTELMLEKFISSNDYTGNPQRQPVIFANACDNGWPEKISLGRSLIRNGSTGIVASSRLSYATIGWDEVKDGGNASLTYYFWKEYINNTKNTGEALSLARFKYLSAQGHSWYDLHNAYTYNYYGDPTTKLDNFQPIFGGIAGHIKTKDGTAVENIKIQIYGSNCTAFTDKEGKFRIIQAPPGSQKLIVMENDKVISELEISIQAGEMLETDIGLAEKSFAALSALTSQLNIEIHEGAGSTEKVWVSNTGTLPIKAKMSSDGISGNWLSADSTWQNINPDNNQSFTIKFNSSVLQQGYYHDLVLIKTNPSLDSLIYIPVNLHVIDTLAPAPITDLQLTVQTNDSITLEWTAPGDNGLQGQLEKYKIWASNHSVENADTISGKLVALIESPKSPGSAEQMKISMQAIDNYKFFIIQSFDDAGHCTVSNEINMQTTDIRSLDNNIPQNFLLQNYPNPFNCETTIEYGISKSGKVKISIVNEIGQLVMTLLDRDTQPGNHSIIWNGTDQYGFTVPSGIYFCRIITAHQNKIIKMMLLK